MVTARAAPDAFRDDERKPSERRNRYQTMRAAMRVTAQEPTQGSKASSTRWLQWGVVELVRSVRTRILASVVLLAAMGLMGAGVAAYVVESSRIDRRIDQAIVQEIDEFSEFAQEGVDPAREQASTPSPGFLRRPCSPTFQTSMRRCWLSGMAGRRSSTPVGESLTEYRCQVFGPRASSPAVPVSWP